MLRQIIVMNLKNYFKDRIPQIILIIQTLLVLVAIYGLVFAYFQLTVDMSKINPVGIHLLYMGVWSIATILLLRKNPRIGFIALGVFIMLEYFLTFNNEFREIIGLSNIGHYD